MDRLKTWSTDMDRLKTWSTDMDRHKTWSTGMNRHKTWSTDMDRRKTWSTDMDRLKTWSTDMDRQKTWKHAQFWHGQSDHSVRLGPQTKVNIHILSLHINSHIKILLLQICLKFMNQRYTVLNSNDMSSMIITKLWSGQEGDIQTLTHGLWFSEEQSPQHLLMACDFQRNSLHNTYSWPVIFRGTVSITRMACDFQRNSLHNTYSWPVIFRGTVSITLTHGLWFWEEQSP